MFMFIMAKSSENLMGVYAHLNLSSLADFFIDFIRVVETV